MRKLLLAMAVLYCLSVPVFASDTLTYFESKATVASDGSAHIDVTITLNMPFDDPKVSIPVFYDIKNLQTNANFEGASCEIEQRSYGIDIVCDISGATSDNHILRLSYDTNNLVRALGSQYHYKQEVYIPFNTTSAYFQVMLPQGSGLVTSLQSPYLPADGSKASDGRMIFIFWSRNSLTAGDGFTAQLTYELFQQDQQPFLLAAIVPIGIAAAGLGWFFFRRKGMTMKMFLPVLKDDEREVMKSLLSHGSGTHQKILVRECGYSKAKVSKVLKSLAERGVVKMERVGRSNRVYLVREFQKKPQKGSGNS